jgi:hypothetical protein
MDRRLRALTLWMVWVIVAAGCTASSSRVENNRYFNPRHNFSIQIPAAWEYSEVPPNWYVKQLTPEDKQKVKLVLSQTDQKGFIAISTDHADTSLLQISMQEEKFMGNLRRLYQKRDKELDKKGIDDYRYKLFKLQNCSTGCTIALEEWSSSDDQFKIIKKEVMYSCGNDATCSVTFALISHQKTLAKNRKRFEEVVASLEPL